MLKNLGVLQLSQKKKKIDLVKFTCSETLEFFA